jgi:hypothetical protein
VSDLRDNKKTHQDGVFHDAAPKDRKTYQTPVLAHWGSLRDLTRAAGISGSSDGGKILLRKTRW